VKLDGAEYLGSPLVPVPVSAFSGASIDFGGLSVGQEKTVVIRITMDEDATGNMDEAVAGTVKFTLNQQP
jgi:polyribonucleotide nucleotidyltransferase